MQENTWQICQIIMWVFGIQTTIIITVMGGFWAAMNKKFEQVDRRFEQIDRRFEKIDHRFEIMDNNMKEIRTSLNRLDLLTLYSG